MTLKTINRFLSSSTTTSTQPSSKSYRTKAISPKRRKNGTIDSVGKTVDFLFLTRPSESLKIIGAPIIHKIQTMAMLDCLPCFASMDQLVRIAQVHYCYSFNSGRKLGPVWLFSEHCHNGSKVTLLPEPPCWELLPFGSVEFGLSGTPM